MSTEMGTTGENGLYGASLPPPAYRLTNNFHEWPTWNYPTLYELYCVGGYTIPGKQNYPAGVTYILEYLFYLVLYIPSLIVIGRPPLFQHSCYKLMFAVGIMDNCIGFFTTFLAGVFSMVGANYCDNNRVLIVVGHIVHGGLVESTWCKRNEKLL